MKLNTREIKITMNLLVEKIEELEKQLDSERDIKTFESNYRKIEDYRDMLHKMTINKN